jgi:Glycosyl transferase family 8
MKSKGIIYIAIGDEYVRMAIESAKSIASHYIGSKCPPIVILTDNPIDLGISLDISMSAIGIKYPANPSVGTAYLKTRLNYLSEFEQTLYLDCDTRVVGDLSPIWDCIGDSIAVAPAYNPIQKYFNYPHDPEASETSIILSKIDDYTQYNTGVLLFEDTLYVDNIFRLWLKEWRRFKHLDNKAFTRAISQGVSVDSLDAKYNQFYPDINADSIIIHYIGVYKQYLKD